jgi:hypothetical protein
MKMNNIVDSGMEISLMDSVSMVGAMEIFMKENGKLA